MGLSACADLHIHQLNAREHGKARLQYINNQLAQLG